jgi:hypothetical protein
MSIKIRPAKVEDAPFLAQMMLQSSRAGKRKGFFDLLFPQLSEEDLLEKLASLAQTEAKSHCNYRNFLVAETGGQCVGSLCSYEPRKATKEIFVKALKEVGCSDDAEDILAISYECNLSISRTAILFDFMEELEGFLDVGVLKALMQKSLLTARLKGYSIAQTIIEIGSLEVELFYKKLGFRVVDEQECERYKEVYGRLGQKLLSVEF